MSDAPQGEGWWQASDLLWYPPQDADGSGGSAEDGSGGRRWVLPVVLVVVVALVAAGVTFVVAGGGDEAAAESVTLEPVASAGADPFTDSVAVNEVTEFPETVSAVIEETAGELTTDEATGTLVAAGGTPGLYGGTRDDSACDVAALTAFLADPANEAKAQAWAGAAGVGVGEIEQFVGRLAPTVLTLDTRVTNHGFRDGRATPRQSVLQAGTAVLVDALGVPRVKCSCGNPLAEPQALDLAAATVSGTQWASFEAGRTVVAQPAGELQESLTLVDVATADTYQEPVGEAAAAPEVAPVTEQDLADAAAGIGEAPVTCQLSEHVLGDMDGDGAEDGAAVAECADPANAGGRMASYQDVFVALSSLDGASRGVDLTLDDSDGVQTWYGYPVDAIEIRDGNLVVIGGGWVDSDPTCCPSLRLERTYEIQGGEPVRIGLETFPA